MKRRRKKARERDREKTSDRQINKLKEIKSCRKRLVKEIEKIDRKKSRKTIIFEWETIETENRGKRQ